jgi:hypothetical protein
VLITRLKFFYNPEKLQSCDELHKVELEFGVELTLGEDQLAASHRQGSVLYQALDLSSA